MTKLTILLTAFILIFTGCNNNQETKEEVNVKKISNVSDVSIQSNAKQAKEEIQKMKEVKDFKVVDLNKDIFIALELKHQYTFQSEKIQKRLKEKLEKELPGHRLVISTDHKLFIELRDLEGKIKKQAINKNQLNKELEHLKKLLDQTL